MVERYGAQTSHRSLFRGLSVGQHHALALSPCSRRLDHLVRDEMSALAPGRIFPSCVHGSTQMVSLASGVDHGRDGGGGAGETGGSIR